MILFLVLFLMFGTPAHAQQVVADPLHAGQNEILFQYLSLNSLWSQLTNNDLSIPVVIMDTGMDCAHPDLADNIDSSEAKSFVDSSPCFDEWGHGTGVAGIINAKNNNSLGIAGIAPNARLIPYKVMTSTVVEGRKAYWLGDNADNTIVNALEAIAQMPDKLVIVNASLALTWPSPRIHDALKKLENKALIFAAAGNDLKDTAKIDYLPCTASDLSNVVCVTAVNLQGLMAGYPNYGSRVDIAAPMNLVTAPVPGGGYTRWFTGTSAATPVAASLMTLALGILRGQGAQVERLTPTMLKQALIEGATPDPELNNGNPFSTIRNPAVVNGEGILTALKTLLENQQNTQE